MRVETLDPAAFGIARATREDLLGGSPAENAVVFRDLVGGATGPVRDAVLLNSAGALIAFDGPPADLAAAFPAALERAATAIDSGAAAALLDRWIKVSTSLR